MRKWMIVTVFTLAGLLGSESRASAFFWCGWNSGWCGGWWTCGYPAFAGYPYGFAGLNGGPGAYYYAPYYGWFSNYNYSHSPYAWPNGYVAGQYPAHLPGVAGHQPNTPIDRFGAAPTQGQPATVVASLPEDAVLLFNGVPATGASGTTRSYQTGPLTPGRAYEYTLTARVTRDGKDEIVTEKVVVKAGESTKVSLMPKTSVAGK